MVRTREWRINNVKLKPHRVLIVVSNMNRSLRFYRDGLGMKVLRDAVREGPSYDAITGIKNVKVRVVFVAPEAGAHLIELVQYLKPKSRNRPRTMSDVGATRICYEVSSVARGLNTLKRRGIKRVRGPVLLEREGVKIAKLLYLYDPDETEVELIETLM